MSRRLLKQKQVLEKLGIQKSWLYAGMKRGLFPLPVRPDPNSKAVRWVESEIDRVISDAVDARNETKAQREREVRDRCP